MTPPTRSKDAVRQQRGHPRSGRTAVEAAIVINVLLVLLLSIFEYGRLIMMTNLIDNAAREGARLVVVNPAATTSLTTTQIQTVVTGYLAGQSVQNLVVQVYQADSTTGANVGAWNTAPPGTDIAVQVDFDYTPIVPVSLGILPSTLHLTSKALMLTEAN